jgi:lysozyme
MSNNPPIPAGYKLIAQISVSPEMTQWAIQILQDAPQYPLFSVVMHGFGALNVLARVEWHDPDFQNHTVHRGVTLYEPIPSLVGVGAPGEVRAPLPLGIDVSGYQPKVDWTQVAGGGISFAFVKATEGTTLVDHSFASHWAGASAARVLRGAYHFFRSRLDGRAQAHLFLAQLRSDPGELPPVLDVEVADGVAGSLVVAGVNAWLDVVTAELGRPIIYTMPGFWNTLPVIPGIAERADLWVANWEAKSPASVKGLPSWKFWQFTNHATITGIPGHAAMDESRFNGTAADLAAYSQAVISARPAAARAAQ